MKECKACFKLVLAIMTAIESSDLDVAYRKTQELMDVLDTYKRSC